VATLLLEDEAEIGGLKGRPELNGCTCVVVSAGEAGVGPEVKQAKEGEAADAAPPVGRYGVRVVAPEEHKGVRVSVKQENLKLVCKVKAPPPKKK
jgi:hypothetical protein